MRQIRERLASKPASSALLTVVAAASVGLNTDLWAPPRFDGAGYAVLGDALASGRGYREINKPGAPRHDHFPPGYPMALAFLWRFTGRSVVAAHLFSTVCTVAAVLLASTWLRTIYAPGPAFLLGLALAVNWTWGRVGGSIQSEPFFMLWEFVTVLIAVHSGRRPDWRAGIVLGAALAASVLVRQVGACLGMAVAIDLIIRGHWRTLVSALITAGVLIVPWALWLAIVHHQSQLVLFTSASLPARIASQAIFYLQRLPDQVTGPFVEVATVLSHRPALAVGANVWAACASGILVWGWLRALRSPRRRLAGLVSFTTLALLVVWPFTEAGRFLIPLVPFVLVGLTEGMAYVVARLSLPKPRHWAAAIVLIVSVPYAAYSIMGGRAAAQRRIHADFDAACQWILHQPARPGPVLTRHPGEVFWQSGRPAIEPDSPAPEAIAKLIDGLGVAYLLIDENRYVNAAPSPLEQYVERYPDRVALVWAAHRGTASVRVFEARRAQ